MMTQRDRRAGDLLLTVLLALCALVQLADVMEPMPTGEAPTPWRIALRVLKAVAYLLGIVFMWDTSRRMRKGHDLLSQAFARCPVCLGREIRSLTTEVRCRICRARWRVAWTFGGDLRGLHLDEPGSFLDETSRAELPLTDDPQVWLTWAQERFAAAERGAEGQACP